MFSRDKNNTCSAINNMKNAKRNKKKTWIFSATVRFFVHTFLQKNVFIAFCLKKIMSFIIILYGISIQTTGAWLYSDLSIALWLLSSVKI